MEVRHVRRWPLILCGGLGGLFAAMALGVAAPDRKEGVSAPLVGQAELSNPTKPVPYSVADRDRRLSEKGLTAGSPVMIRIFKACLLYTSPSPRDRQKSRMPSSA